MSATPRNPPNVVLLTAHDLGRYLGCYGREAETPRIDSLTADGVRFENAFCPTPYCAPSRASIQTGLLPHNHGLLGFPYHPFREDFVEEPNPNPTKGWEIGQGVKTLPMYLNEIGYDTHLCSFQHAASIPERLGYGTIHVESTEGRSAPAVAGTVEQVLRSETSRDAPVYVEANTANTHYSHCSGRHRDDPAAGYDGPSRNEITLPPHLPEDDRLRGMLADVYHDAFELDRAVGRILDTLEAEGLARETLVVFTADHGIHEPRGKYTCYERGIEVPLVMRLPGRIDGGIVREELVSHVDILPTIMEIAGVDPPATIDGRSVAPPIDDGVESGYEPREAVVFESNWCGRYLPVRGIRTRQFKYVRNLWPDHPLNVNRSPWARDIGPRDLPHGDSLPVSSEEELYDLESDPHEFHDLSADTEHADVHRRLRQTLKTRLEDDGDPITDGPITPVETTFDTTL